MIKETEEQQIDLTDWVSNYLCTTGLTEAVEDVQDKMVELLGIRGMDSISIEHVISCFNKAANEIRSSTISTLDGTIGEKIGDVEIPDDYIHYDMIEDSGYTKDDDVKKQIKEAVEEAERLLPDCPKCHHTDSLEERENSIIYCTQCCREFELTHKPFLPLMKVSC